MKMENIPADIKSKSLKEAREEIDNIISKLEKNQNNLEEFKKNYERLMKLNNYVNVLYQRKMKDSWYEGNTGIPPLDDAINGAKKYGFTHHINRLMIISNLMNLFSIIFAISYKVLPKYKFGKVLC